MEIFETLEYPKWHFQHFEKAKYLISQFAKKGRHDKNYQLQKSFYKTEQQNSKVSFMRIIIE